MTQENQTKEFDVLIVGAGFAGIYQLLKLRKLGLSAVILEKADQIGGTWHWNRYPGARCDIPSLEYSYQFDEDLQQEWNWSEKYSAQPEILDYINHVADRFELRDGIQFEEEVLSANFNESTSKWHITSSKGQYETRFCIFATGCLSIPNKPDFQGLENFKGQLLQTSSWPQEEQDFTGKRVAIIGTGSSAIQSIPLIAEQAEVLYVFQRTPNYSIPSNNGPMDKSVEKDVKSRYSQFRKDNYLNGFGIAAISDESLISESDINEVNQQLEENWQSAGLGFFGVYDPDNNDLIEVPISTEGSFIQFMTSDKNGKIWFVEQEGNKIGTVNTIEIPVDVSQIKTIDSVEIEYTEIASPLIALGIIATALFFVKSIYDKRRLNSLINS